MPRFGRRIVWTKREASSTEVAKHEQTQDELLGVNMDES
jgi:hypothetical protein